MTTEQLFHAALEGLQETLEQHKAKTGTPEWDSIRDKNGNTLAAAAASRGKLHIIQYLVRNGASLNIPNKDGRVDIQIAFEDGHPNTARGLIALYEQAGLEIPLPAAARKQLAT